jgi:DNA or RNA helicases of superfamily II
MSGKAILSNRIYMSADAKRQKLIDQELTYSIPSYNPMEPPTIIKNMGRISSKLITVPMGRMDLIPEDFEIIDKRTLVPVTFPDFKFDLRDSQAKVYNEVEDNAIINAFVSWGKTFTAIAIAAKLGQKTLIVVHTLALRKQWEDEIEKCLGIVPGVIGSGKFDTDPIIVVSNVQTLGKKMTEIQKMFGTINFG